PGRGAGPAGQRAGRHPQAPRRLAGARYPGADRRAAECARDPRAVELLARLAAPEAGARGHRHCASRAASRRRARRLRQPSGALMLWLAVYLPLLPLEVFCGRSDRPTVVIDERNRVLLRNDAAITAGIAPNAS